MSETVASAVAIVPDDPEMDSNHNGLKRRQSDELETDDNKRRRTSAGKNSPEDPPASNTEPSAQSDNLKSTTKSAQKEEPSREPRRKSTVPDDKQRSKRLFGALLGNLNASQPNDRAAKRRADIEARRKAELAKQDNERLEDKQRRSRELAQHRKRKQIYVDEEDMHTRHRNLLDIANMLQTKAEPKLYFRPWDLLPEEDTRIEDQLIEAQDQVDKEVAEFEIEKKKRLAVLNGVVDNNEEGPRTDAEPFQPVATEAAQGNIETPSHNNSADSEPASKPGAPKDHSANGGENSEVAASSEVQGEGDVKPIEVVNGSDEKQEEAEDDGDHIVEGDEDNVIY